MSAPLQFLDACEELLGLPGVASVRWRDRKGRHLVSIDWTPATSDERTAIHAAVHRLIDAHPEDSFAVTMGEGPDRGI